MKVTVYDGDWRGCTWFVEVNNLTLDEVINHMQKWFEFQEKNIEFCATHVIERSSPLMKTNKYTLVHKLKLKEVRNNSNRPLVIFEEHWKPQYRIKRYWELGLLEGKTITPLKCDKNGNLSKINFSYPLKGLLISFEKSHYLWVFQHEGSVYTWLGD